MGACCGAEMLTSPGVKDQESWDPLSKACFQQPRDSHQGTPLEVSAKASIYVCVSVCMGGGGGERHDSP